MSGGAGNAGDPSTRKFAFGPFRLRDAQRVAVWVVIIAGFLGLLLLGIDSLTHGVGSSRGGAALDGGAAGATAATGATSATGATGASQGTGGQGGGQAAQGGSSQGGGWEQAGEGWVAGEYGVPATAAAGADGTAGPATPGAAALEEWQTVLEARLAGVLSCISGAGRVIVWVDLAAGPELVPLRQETVHTTRTDEQDPGGGTRTVRDEERDGRVLSASSGSSLLGAEGTGGALLGMVLAPRVEGVLVIAEGAGDPRVRADLAAAAAAALGLPAHRVTILPARGPGG